MNLTSRHTAATFVQMMILALFLAEVTYLNRLADLGLKSSKRSLARADAQLYFYIVANGDEWNTIAVQYLLCMWCVENQQFLTLPATAEMTANKRFEQKKQKLSEQFKSKISIFMTNCALLLLYLINYLMMQV